MHKKPHKCTHEHKQRQKGTNTIATGITELNQDDLEDMTDEIKGVAGQHFHMDFFVLSKA